MAFSALIVESSPPTRIMMPPPWKKWPATSTSAVSFFKPRNCQLGIPATGTAPSAAKATSR